MKRNHVIAKKLYYCEFLYILTKINYNTYISIYIIYKKNSQCHTLINHRLNKI